MRYAIGVLVCLTMLVGCSSKPKPAQLSGMVTFKGQPVPAGYVSFTPDVEKGNKGQLRVFQIKDGAYDSAKEASPGTEVHALHRGETYEFEVPEGRR